MTTDPLVTAMLPMLHKLCDGQVCIAIGGSRAKGSADQWADLDIYLFSTTVRTCPDRETLVSALLPEARNVTTWGCDDPFVEGGTDFLLDGIRVECWHRNQASVEAKLQASLNGEITRQYSAWAVMGFFDHTVLADIRTMHIVADAHGTINRWKQTVCVYPETLRRSLLQRFMREAAFWPNSPHYLSAIERVDLIYTNAIVQHTLHALIQVLFALNREYFPGEKQLINTMDKLALRPRGLSDRIRQILNPGMAIGRDQLAAQANALADLVVETKSLVLSDQS
ncbi:MAG: DUF4037 domain-containing protein [Nitrospirae bacterium]|nr:DUF4037 domain-containing protein [Nitrospirota bacterium]